MDLRKTFVFALCAFVLVAIFSCGNDSGVGAGETVEFTLVAGQGYAAESLVKVTGLFKYLFSCLT